MGAVPTELIRRRARRRRWARRAALGLALLIIGAVVYAYVTQVLAVRALQAELDRLQAQRQALEEENRRLLLTLSLRDDPETMEYLARAALGLIKRGEIKYLTGLP